MATRDRWFFAQVRSQVREKEAEHVLAPAAPSDFRHDSFDAQSAQARRSAISLRHCC
jgi:hypothetical protein